MMKYERLKENIETLCTHNERHIPVFHITDGKKHEIYLIREIVADCREILDKIEQGTLVDTETYFIVEENQWAGKNRFLVCQNAVQLNVCDFCESREEAEKKIKELQNG